MPTTLFTDHQAPAVTAAWLNEVNGSTFGPTAVAGTLRAQLNSTAGAGMVKVASGITVEAAIAAASGGSASTAKMVSSIALLRAVSKTAFDQVTVTGYYASGDGGGGTYYYVAADTTSVDNGGSIIVASDGGRWKLARQASLSVLQFGADPTGVANSTAAFNAMPAGVVSIPAGVYSLSGFVPKSGTLYECAPGATLQQRTAGTGIVTYTSGSSNITFRGAFFKGLAGDSAGGIVIFDNSATTFRNNYEWENCKFDLFGGMAVVGGGIKGGLFHGCTFTRTAQLNIPSGIASYPAIWLSDSSGGYTACQDVIVSDCSFSDMYWSGVYALGSYIKITGCRFRNTRESCIFISEVGTYIDVIGNRFDTTIMQNISASGVEVGGNFCTVVGNSIRNCAAWGVSVQDCKFFTVTGNNITFCGVGIGVISSYSVNQTRYGSIKGNTVTNNTNQGLYLYRQATGLEIDDCDFSDNWLAANGGGDFQMTATNTIHPRVRLNNNSSIDCGTTSIRLNLGALGTGAKVLLSTPIRPELVTFNMAVPGAAPAISNGFARFDSAGSITQGSQAQSATYAITSISCLEILSGSSVVFTMAATAFTWNSATKLWDLNVNISLNGGGAYWCEILVRA